MAGPFELQLQAFAEKAKGAADQVVRKVVIDVASSVVMRSPVDTGRFRANWTNGVGAINATTTLATDKSGGETIGKLTAAIPEKAAGQVFYIANSLPYAQRLEYGYSKQAPAGMVRLTVAEWQTFVDKAAAEVRV